MIQWKYDALSSKLSGRHPHPSELCKLWYRHYKIHPYVPRTSRIPTRIVIGLSVWQECRCHEMTIIIAPLLLVSALVVALAWRKKSHVLYPPGPPPKPIIGNALDIPSERPWVKYLEWSKQLDSDIIHLSAMGTHIIILHKMEDVAALMEKRSAIYSSRPWMPIVELLGTGNNTAIIPYGKEWRKQRAMYHESLRKETMPFYHRMFTEKVHLFADLLLRSPDQFRHHCKWLSSAIALSAAFGYEVAVGDMNDHYVALAERVMAAASELTHPGGTLINAIPILRFIPTWVPGASTQRRAAEVKEMFWTFRDRSFELVMRNLLAGTAKESTLTRLLERRLKDKNTMVEDEEELKDAISGVYFASTETIQATQLVFIMAMAMHPAAQRRAQAEIYRVVGVDRLPTYDDRPSLSYIDALLRETLRLMPVVPLAVPHVTSKDDVYKGFFIPKGTLVLPNLWAISRDETMYENPGVFNPDRFLNPDGTLNEDRTDVAYGYGRRICPGRFMANDVLWMMMATVLSTYNISKAKDENGIEIDINPEFSSGLTSFPCPFKCSIVPRSSEAQELVRFAAMNAEESMK
ncbi:hypothetical protein APHAL10511_007627 [Amanita phalloides]|nr:hypothetical protein APHAL10511_007627 [Amanita phalloides]